MAEFKDNVVFPITISYGSMSSYAWDVDIVETDSGAENRNGKWAHTRANYNAIYGVRTTEDMVDLIKTWHAVRGSLYGLNYVDPLDNNSTDTPTSPGDIGSNNTITNTDQLLGTGDGLTNTFQTIKTYSIYGETYVRNILKPLASTYLLAIDGVADSSYSLNSTGVVTLDDITLSATSATSISATVTRIGTGSAHGLVDGQTVLLSGFTGDWAALNNTRFIVTIFGSVFFDVTHDSSGYAAYSSNGGQAKTLPQTGEAVTAGFEFYVPVRFNQKSLSTRFDDYEAHSTDVELVEIRL